MSCWWSKLWQFQEQKINNHITPAYIISHITRGFQTTHTKYYWTKYMAFNKLQHMNNDGILWCYIYAVCIHYSNNSVFHCSISMTVTVLSCDFCESVNEVWKRKCSCYAAISAQKGIFWRRETKYLLFHPHANLSCRVHHQQYKSIKQIGVFSYYRFCFMYFKGLTNYALYQSTV